MRFLMASAAFLLLHAGPAAAQGLDHSALDAVLRRNVAADGVRYAALAADRGGLDQYLARVGAVTDSAYRSWPRSEQLAYLINSYNAIVLRQVLDAYPIKRSLAPAALVRPANSVWQIAGFFGGTRHNVAGQRLTLDDIEHKLLRATLKEPRIHAALVCAAVSCPPLRAEAYRADRIEAQLDDQMRRFLADPKRNRVDRARGEVRLSEIFKWFAEDFGGADGIIPFVARYMDAPTRAWLNAGRVRVTYFDYDWNLNDASAH
jgi:hypothetical protein